MAASRRPSNRWPLHPPPGVASLQRMAESRARCIYDPPHNVEINENANINDTSKVDDDLSQVGDAQAAPEGFDVDDVVLGGEGQPAFGRRHEEGVVGETTAPVVTRVQPHVGRDGVGRQPHLCAEETKHCRQNRRRKPVTAAEETWTVRWSTSWTSATRTSARTRLVTAGKSLSHR